MASTVLPNGIIVPEKFSRDWYADLYHNWEELDNLLGGGTPKDGTLTIQKNGTDIGTFSANQATDETINITVPTVNDATLTIQKNGSTVGTFSANQATDETVNIEVPDVNNGTLTIQQNGTTVDTFSANSSSDKTVNITVPTTTSELTNDSGYITGVAWNDVSNKPTFATVATSGSYNDLSNKPTIPTVNDATLTIQKNGTTIDTFTANSSTDKTVNIQCVDLNSNQTVGGIKTFSNAPVVNSISLDGKIIDTDVNDNMAFNGHIVDTIEEQGDGYIRYSNGIQICFLATSMLNNETEKQITFPRPFGLNPAVLLCGQTSYLYLNGWTTTHFVARVDGGATIYFSWIAIGKWK